MPVGSAFQRSSVVRGFHLFWRLCQVHAGTEIAVSALRISSGFERNDPKTGKTNKLRKNISLKNITMT
jgi:hypothetical protein